MKYKYIECHCTCSEHTMRVTHDTDPDFDCLYVEVFLNHYRGFWRRLWIGVKYIFGYKCKYGHFDEFIWDPHKVKQVQGICEEFFGEDK